MTVVDDTPVSELASMMAEKLNISKEVINKDLEVLKKERLETVAHVRFLLSNRQLWKMLDLPLIEKAVLEELLAQ